MDEMDAFERQVADVSQRVVGPPRHVDALGIARRARESDPRRRFQTMFQAAKLVVAGAIVALFGGFLLAGALMTRTSEEPIPGATTSPMPTAQVSGRIITRDVPRPGATVRLVVILEQADADEVEEPLGEYVLEEPARTAAFVDVDALPFSIEYPAERIVEGASYLLRARVAESGSGRIIAVSEVPVPVITDGNPVEEVELRLIPTPDDGTVPQLSGYLVPAPDLPDPAGPVRLVVTLVDASASEGAAPLAEAVLEDVTRIRPPRLYVLDYDPALIDASGRYLLVARMQDAETGELLGTGGDPIPVITAGAPIVGIDIRLAEAPGAP